MSEFIKKNPQISYVLVIIISLFLLVIPFGTGFYFAYNLFHYTEQKSFIEKQVNENINYYFMSEAEKSEIVDNYILKTRITLWVSFGVFLLSIILYSSTAVLMKRLLNETIQANEYDEFGRSKKKKYENLTRKEREAMDLIKTEDLERILSTSVVKSITKKGSSNPEEDLNNMIGLIPVKTKLNEMISRMKFEKYENKKKKKKDRTNYMSGRHFLFLGSAGTGKTQTARILTGALYKYGYIPQNKIIEVDGNFFKASENSAVKTKYVTQIAYGGVLFIDEAYAMAEGAYSADIISTLIKEIEDNRDRFICILAGYKNDMIRLIDQNEGFKSRIKEFIDFPDYTNEELKEIFISMCNNKGFVPTSEAVDNFEIRINKERKLKGFGNGRTVRNIFEDAVDKHATTFTPQTRYQITGSDISTAVKSF